MGPDEAADLVADLSEERQEQLLSLMEPEEASDVRELLAYGEETAGGLMTTDFITITSEMTAEQVIERLRELHPDADQVYYLYVTDADGYVGTITPAADAAPETRSATSRALTHQRASTWMPNRSVPRSPGTPLALRWSTPTAGIDRR
jgi:Mg/Co/Ni transporter MgtE